MTHSARMERGEPMITSMKMKAFDAESVTSEMLTEAADTADPATADSPDSSDKPRFSGRFHRRSIRRGSKYKMTHRSPTELSKVNILNFDFDTMMNTSLLFYFLCVPT